jgi:molybdopterin-guanine dinucleotide biosynthesis protein A
MHDVSAFVLAGGQSRRMGHDKALLTLGGETLLERALRLAHQVAPRVAILGPRERYATTEEWIIEDEFPGCGPLAGIHAALQATDTDLNVILAVDMPFVPADFLAYLIERAQSSPHAQVVVPRVGGIVQGTCFACRRAFRSACEQRLRLGFYRVEEAIEFVRPEHIEEEEIRARGFGPDIFRNLNIPEDFTGAQGTIARQGIGFEDKGGQ